MENKDNKAFQFTYSAKQQEEIKAIRKKYSPSEEEDKLTKLRRLDTEVTAKANTAALISGITGALLLGCGMSLIMTELGSILGISSLNCTIAGVLIGVAGIVLICVAYPIYNGIVKSQRRKIAPEILRLTDELMK